VISHGPKSTLHITTLRPPAIIVKSRVFATRQVPWMTPIPPRPLRQLASEKLKNGNRLFWWLLAGSVVTGAMTYRFDEGNRFCDELIDTLMERTPKDAYMDAMFLHISFAQVFRLIPFKLYYIDLIQELLVEDVPEKAKILAIYNLTRLAEQTEVARYMAGAINWDVIFEEKLLMSSEETHTVITALGFLVLTSSGEEHTRSCMKEENFEKFCSCIALGLKSEDNPQWVEFVNMLKRSSTDEMQMLERLAEKKDTKIAEERFKFLNEKSKTQDESSEDLFVEETETLDPEVKKYYVSGIFSTVYGFLRWNARSLSQGHHLKQFIGNALIRAPLTGVVTMYSYAIASALTMDVIRDRRDGESKAEFLENMKREAKMRKMAQLFMLFPSLWLLSGLVPYTICPLIFTFGYGALNNLEYLEMEEGE